MTHLKRKLMMTLVALLALTTQAWATTVTWNSSDFNRDGAFTKDDVTVTTSNDARYYGNFYAYGVNTFTTTLGNFTKIEIVFKPESSPMSVSGWNYEVIEASQPFPDDMPDYWEYTSKLTWTGDAESVSIEAGVMGIQSITFTFADATATPVPLTWDATAKTATLTNGMPAGNVTVSVEYFPQATMDDGAVTAATDVKATTEDALVTIDKNKLTGVAKLMYYVSTKATAPDYDTEGWTDQVPTAANYTEAGDVKVWYYAVGADSDDPAETYSDGDICATALTVTLGAAPLWNAEFDLTNAPEEDKAGKWSTDIPEGGVKKGTEVTVTYTGSKKIIGVKAEKVKVAEGHALTSAKLGEIVCSDGKAYAAADKDILPKGVKAEALVCYVVGNGRGLALALTDEGEMDWKTAQNTCAAHTPAFTGGTWKLASQGEWNNMINAAGGFGALRDGFSSVGGTNMQSDRYWSSTDDDDRAQDYNFSVGEWDDDDKTWSWYVRACLVW